MYASPFPLMSTPQRFDGFPSLLATEKLIGPFVNGSSTSSLRLDNETTCIESESKRIWLKSKSFVFGTVSPSPFLEYAVQRQQVP